MINNGWIPTSERVPNEKECNLFKPPHPCYRRFICMVQLAGINPMVRELYFCEISGWTLGTVSYNKYVTAWQPLHPAWKESVK